MPDFLSTQSGEPGTSHLSSNNPFRNRAVSPSLPLTPTSPFEDPLPSTSSARPVSRNPFLDPANGSSAAPKSKNDLLIDLDDMPSKADDAKSQSFTADIFSSLSIENKTIPATKFASPAGDSAQPRRQMDDRSQASVGPPPPGRGRPSGGPPPRAKNIPPRRSPSPTHRPSRPQEEASKRHHQSNSAASGRPAHLGVAPDRSSGRRPSTSSRPRRNSESSVAGGPDSNVPKADKTLRDARRREQTLREKGSSHRSNRRNDIIDQLDATSIFGNVFHHDGPFDALNPHRNRHNRRAPMQAFPKDSLNNVLGGSGPLNTRPDHRTFMGQGEDEAFRDFATSREKISSPATSNVFDPLSRGSVLHGDETLGLGTSTFLEGTPAARTAIQRREAEKAQDSQDNSLQRKKSLAQRFRSTRRGPREPNASRAFSSDGTPIESRSRGYGTERSDRPFDEFESSRGEDVITVRRKAPAMPGSPPSPPHIDLERRSTADAAVPMAGASKNGHYATPSSGSAGDDGQKPTSGGLLARVKSLKGGRRAPPPPPMKDS